MDGKHAIEFSMDLSSEIVLGYLQDLTDEEMMHRPCPRSNHIKWQLGHLIQSEHQMIDTCLPGAMPPLPDGFAERYGKETATIDDATAFDSKDQLMMLFDEQRAATHQALAGCSAADLDQPAPEPMREYAPTVGDAFNVQGIHWVMHAGQWSVIRRQLGRDPIY